MFTPGIILFQVIIPGSTTFKFSCVGVGLITASAVTITALVVKVNAFPVVGASTLT